MPDDNSNILKRAEALEVSARQNHQAVMESLRGVKAELSIRYAVQRVMDMPNRQDGVSSYWRVQTRSRFTRIPSSRLNLEPQSGGVQP